MTRYGQSAAGRMVPHPREILPGDGILALNSRTGIRLKADFPEAEKLFRRNLESVAGEPFFAENLSVEAAHADQPPEGYAFEILPEELRVEASDATGLRHALRSLRQLSESERGVLRSRKRILPCMRVRDFPSLRFRCMHLCWFPETEEWEIEKQIRLAAYYKYNYVILESWGVFRYESHPEFCWSEYAVERSSVERLVNLAGELGIVLIPELNIFGHASMSRPCTAKNLLLQFRREYEPLFEPDGWSWCVSNPYTRAYLEDLVNETMDWFGSPGFFHLGFDEAFNAGTCFACAENYPEKLKTHLLYFCSLLRRRNVRPMIWHDMLLDCFDPRWNAEVVSGEKDSAELLLESLPADTVICDWQYYYPSKDGREPEWRTLSVFHERGFDTVACGWQDSRGTASLGRTAAERGLFGYMQTAWHHVRMFRLFFEGANAAWNPGAKGADGVFYRNIFNRHVLDVDRDMGISTYRRAGTLTCQVFPSDAYEGN